MVTNGFLMGALALISALTGLTVEGLKKVLDERRSEERRVGKECYS